MSCEPYGMEMRFGDLGVLGVLGVLGGLGF